MLISNSFTLRVMIKHAQLAPHNREVFEKAVYRVVHMPLSNLGSDPLVMPLMFRFTIDYLYRQNLLDTNGKPSDLCGIVAHLFHTEPSNLIFVSVLASGWFKTVCDDESTTELEKMRLIMHMIAFIFHRLPAPLTAIKNRTASVVVLPSPGCEIENILESHDRSAVACASEYFKCFIRSGAPSEQENEKSLPLSSRQFPPDDCHVIPLPASLLELSLSPEICSPFCGIAGRTDKFESVNDMKKSLRSNLFIDPRLLAQTQPIQAALNAWALDFFKHGQLEALEHDNGIQPGNMYDLILTMCLTIKAITAVLEKRHLECEDAGTDVAYSSRNVVRVFKAVSKEFETKFRAAYPQAYGKMKP